jgi:hypothetical protein
MDEKPSCCRAAAVRKWLLFLAGLALVPAVLLGPSCVPGRPSDVNFAWLRVGTSDETAEWFMGKPDGRGTGDAGERWCDWHRENVSYEATFRNNQLISKSSSESHIPG